jgi:hypothetical protein
MDFLMLRRRQFLVSAALVPAAVMLAQTAESAAAPAPADLPAVNPNDALAKALGYVEDATKVDKKKYPQFKAGSHCANCKLVLGVDGAKRRPCSIFPGKSVSPAGWCISWAAKS